MNTQYFSLVIGSETLHQAQRVSVMCGMTEPSAVQVKSSFFQHLLTLMLRQTGAYFILLQHCFYLKKTETEKTSQITFQMT